MSLRQETPLPGGENPPAENGSVFCTTLWTVVVTVRSANDSDARSALERLCQIYWRPVYAFIRRHGTAPHDAEDLTQEFFAFVLEKETLKNAEKEKGRFRTFLLTALTNFLRNQWDKQRRLKRGGSRQFISFDDAEAAYQQAPAEDANPEAAFDRRWAFDLIERARQRLKSECAQKSELFQALEPLLTQELTGPLRLELAARLNMNESALKVALHRMRRRFGACLREEIAQTVRSRDEIEDEIRRLFTAVSM